jgi:hypothetical protein
MTGQIHLCTNEGMYTYTFDNYYEVQVEDGIDKQVDDLFGTVPEVVDVDVSFRDL